MTNADMQLLWCGAVLNAQLPWGVGRLWTEALLPAIYTALVAAGGTVISGLLTLPSLASDELREVLACTLRSVGSSISGCQHFRSPPPPLF